MKDLKGETVASSVALDVFYFIVFFSQIIKNFLTDFTPPGDIVPNRNFLDIATRYVHTKFGLDLICIIPFHWILEENFHEFNYLFFIKILRLYRGLDLLNMKKL